MEISKYIIITKMNISQTVYLGRFVFRRNVKEYRDQHKIIVGNETVGCLGFGGAVV